MVVVDICIYIYILKGTHTHTHTAVQYTKRIGREWSGVGVGGDGVLGALARAAAAAAAVDTTCALH